jgi:hypothetical protein
MYGEFTFLTMAKSVYVAPRSRPVGRRRTRWLSTRWCALVCSACSASAITNSRALPASCVFWGGGRGVPQWHVLFEWLAPPHTRAFRLQCHATQAIRPDLSRLAHATLQVRGTETWSRYHRETKSRGCRCHGQHALGNCLCVGEKGHVRAAHKGGQQGGDGQGQSSQVAGTSPSRFARWAHSPSPRHRHRHRQATRAFCPRWQHPSHWRCKATASWGCKRR